MNAAQQRLLKSAIQYRYYVAYQYANGFGGIELTMTLPIRGFDDVLAATKVIKQNSKIKGDVVLTNWILF